MKAVTLACAALGLALSAGCRGANWQAGPAALTMGRQVGAALDDPVPDAGAEPFDPRAVPRFDGPKKLRPCCAFGMDLGVKLGAVPVPGYEIGNLLSVEDIGPHEYNNGTLTVQPGSDRGPVILEKNGLVYTCRGGFIDLAHIRDNADLALFLSWGIMPLLPGGGAVDLPSSDGARRRVVIKAVPRALLERYGRARVATVLAEWAALRLSVWHEIATWYGYETVAGISERESAFTPEDLYSNLLGIKLSVGIFRSGGARSRDAYNHAMDDWIKAALTRLVPLPKEVGRQAMQALDGLWWDSKRRVPEFELVTRRSLDHQPPLRPWRVGDAMAEERVPAAVRVGCAKAPPPLSLDDEDRLGGSAVAEIVSVELLLEEGWKPQSFPLPEGHSRPLTPADFPTIIEAIRKEGRSSLGPRFDQPR